MGNKGKCKRNIAKLKASSSIEFDYPPEEMNIILKLCKNPADDTVLLPAASGISTFSKYFRDKGFEKITDVDVSTMLDDNDEFDAIVDKGALKLDKTSFHHAYIIKVKKLLKIGGRYICVVTAKDRVFGLLFESFRFGWKTTVDKVAAASSKHSVFVVVAKKKNPATPVTHVKLRCDCGTYGQALYEALQKESKKRAEYISDAVTVHTLENVVLGAKGPISVYDVGRVIKISSEVFSRALLIDSDHTTNNFVLYILPHLRVSRGLYTSKDWQSFIVERHRTARLLLVFKDETSATYPTEDVEKGIDLLVENLTPESVVDIVTVRVEGSVVETPLYKFTSEENGEISIEDFRYEEFDTTFRSLTFTRVGRKFETMLARKESTEAENSADSSGETEVSHKFLGSQYHNEIIAAAFIFRELSGKPFSQSKAMVLGLGAGLLPLFMRQNLPHLKIEVWEKDRQLLKEVETFFCFKQDEHLKVRVGDWKIAKSNVEGEIDILIVDEPKQEYADLRFMETAMKLLSENGILIMSLPSFPEATAHAATLFLIRTLGFNVFEVSSGCAHIAFRRGKRFKEKEILDAQKKVSKSSSDEVWGLAECSKVGGLLRTEQVMKESLTDFMRPALASMIQ